MLCGFCYIDDSIKYSSSGGAPSSMITSGSGDTALLQGITSRSLSHNTSASTLAQLMGKNSKPLLAPASAVTNQQPILPQQRIISSSQVLLLIFSYRIYRFIISLLIVSF